MKPGFVTKKTTYIPANTCMLVSVDRVGTVTDDAFFVEAEKLEDRPRGVWTRPAVYSNCSANRICIENWSHYGYMLEKDTVVGSISSFEEVYSASEASNETPTEAAARIVTYDTVKEAAEHWAKVEEAINFGDTSDEMHPVRNRLMKLFKEFHDIFALNTTELGLAKDVEFDIEITEQPPKGYPRRLPHAIMQKVYDKLLADVAAGIMKHSNGSEFASPIVVVRKKDGDIRIASDFRQLNMRTVLNAAPLPRIDDIFDAMGAITMEFITALDLASGYHQIAMSPKAQKMSAIVCGPYHLEWLRMPFGLSQSPPWFMNFMTRTLDGIDNRRIFVFIDDIVIVSETVEIHEDLIRKVFTRLREVGLRLKPSKCEFLCRSIKFLGLLLDKKGLRTDPSKIEAVRTYPEPDSIKELRIFLGMAGYFRRFIKDFSLIARPLTKLMTKDSMREWTDDCQIAFDKLKTALITAPVLVYPDFNKPFYIECDASGDGVGGQLLQRSGDDPSLEGAKCLLDVKEPLLTQGDYHPIAFVSKTFSKHELNYGASEKEALAVVYTCEQFRHYVLDKPVFVITDCVALRTLLSSKILSQKLARWALAIQALNPVIMYRPGKVNEVADGMSRKPTRDWQKMMDDSDPIDKEEPSYVGRVTVERTVPTQRTDSFSVVRRAKTFHQPGQFEEYLDNSQQQALYEVAQSQREDERLSAMIGYLFDETVDPDYADFIRMENSHFVLLHDVLWRQDAEFPELRVVVPKSERQGLLQESHGAQISGHLGWKKTYGRLVAKYYWPRMKQEVVDYCQHCLDCAARRGQHRTHKVPLLSVPFEHRKFHTMAIDVMEIGPAESGNRYTILAYDLFTKDVFGCAVPDQKASTLAHALCETVFFRYGVPRILLSDLGANLMSAIFREMCRIMGISRLYTTAYNPQCNGAIERFHQTLQGILSHVAKLQPNKWDDYLQAALYAYRTAPHAAHGYPPYFLTFGMMPELPSASAFAAVKCTDTDIISVDEYLSGIVQVLDQTYEAAAGNIEDAQAAASKHFDKFTKPNLYQVGDIVWFHSLRHRRGKLYKLMRPYVGPMRIESIHNYTVILQYVDDPDGKREKTHVSKLSMAFSSMALELEHKTPKKRVIGRTKARWSS